MDRVSSVMQPGGLFAMYVPPITLHCGGMHATRHERPSDSSCSYGPFNYSGTFTTDSNRRFDGWLKSRNAASGIRDFEAVRDSAVKVGKPRARLFECIIAPTTALLPSPPPERLSIYR
jgi:hypothetical protein